MSEKSLYNVERETFSKFFLVVYELTGAHLQKEIKAIRAHWVKPFLTSPAFEHLTFAYKNQIFCVLINIFDESTQKFSLTEGAVDLLIEECQKNDLVPCIFPVKVNNTQKPDINTLKPFEEGWNLIHAVTREPIKVSQLGTDAPTPMSQWELHDFAIQTVRNYIKDTLKYKILSQQNIVGVNPQIWFKDEHGTSSWVVIQNFIYPATSPEKELTKEYLDKLIKESNEHGKGVFPGYIAKVGFYGLWQYEKGKLMRGEPVHVKFTGLEQI